MFNRKILLFFLFSIVTSCFAQEEYVLFPGIQILLWPDKIKYSNFDEGFESQYSIYSQNDFNYLETSKNKYIFMKSDNWLFLIPENGDIIYGTKKTKDDKGPPELNHVKFYAITSSSYLSENIRGQIYNYKSENLLNYDLSKSWVEGDSGDGSGENLEAKLYKDQVANILIIYNGFISREVGSLYYDNARAKNIIVKLDSGNQYEFTLKDNPNYQEIVLPEKSNSFKIIIKSVYSGNKYNDLAISGLFANLKSIEYKRN
ncbi:MAG: hypothetical protein JXR64_11880 [Spirochaetales bacterium]|nr:hypothetical protein [Spirochaetales bacterium]